MPHSVRLVFALLVVVLLATGCADKHLFSDSTNYYMTLPEDTIADEILFLEKIIKEKEAGATDHVPPEIYLYLTLLYSHNHNPTPDYDKALTALDRYEKLAPPEAKGRLEIGYLRNILLEIKPLAQLREQNQSLLGEKTLLLKQCAALDQKLDTLHQENLAIQKENLAIKERIDQLKMLDIRLEQKKRTIK
ncbi:MAG: hypothetical protein C4531_16945 [Desulfurivibrio sp.]|jgi:hypothetical protein|nr:MAG: hypothetical protein C4531_16945 [Desulfurivibrio sp.]